MNNILNRICRNDKCPKRQKCKWYSESQIAGYISIMFDPEKDNCYTELKALDGLEELGEMMGIDFWSKL